jgi:hypothetical protein
MYLGEKFCYVGFVPSYRSCVNNGLHSCVIYHSWINSGLASSRGWLLATTMFVLLPGVHLCKAGSSHWMNKKFTSNMLGNLHFCQNSLWYEQQYTFCHVEFNLTLCQNSLWLGPKVTLYWAQVHFKKTNFFLSKLTLVKIENNFLLNRSSLCAAWKFTFYMTKNLLFSKFAITKLENYFFILPLNVEEVRKLLFVNIHF